MKVISGFKNVRGEDVVIVAANVEAVIYHIREDGRKETRVRGVSGSEVIIDETLSRSGSFAKWLSEAFE